MVALALKAATAHGLSITPHALVPRCLTCKQWKKQYPAGRDLARTVPFASVRSEENREAGVLKPVAGPPKKGRPKTARLQSILEINAKRARTA